MEIKEIKEANKVQKPSADTKMDEKTAEVEKFVARRVQEMQDFRKDMKVEERWKEADIEYVPSELAMEGKGRKRFESDEETGWRSRLVPVVDSEQGWRSKNSDPVLLVKIQTAIATIIDRHPEAVLTPIFSHNEQKTALQYALWKRNWNVSQAKDMYKLFTFDMAKYGLAFGRSYPRKISYDKDVLVAVNEEDPSKNTYERRTNIWFNDVAKERLNPFRTWIDEQTKPYDDYSMNDCYYEKDYSYDAARVEFGKYKNFDKLVPGPLNLQVVQEEDKEGAEAEDQKKRQDLITIGFYENRRKDLNAIRIPKLQAALHYCPLPNDDGMLSVFCAPWILRSADRIDGISLWEIIKQKKSLYDKMQNMTMDQLVLSIMKMFFYTGTNNLVGDGRIKITPGKGVQIVNGKIDFLEVPGPGKESFEGLKYVKSSIDDDSGITPTLEGEITGKTLGEVLHAKEASLKRLKTPVENIAYAMEQDAYITSSWMWQVYSTPEVKSFVSMDAIRDYEMETGLTHASVVTDNIDPMTGEAMGPFTATFLPELNLQLDRQGGKLVESRQERFFKVGQDIPAKDLKWRGIFKIVQKSIIAPSEELEKQRKMEVFNIIVPLLPQPPEIFAKSVKQLLKVNEENPKDWLPDVWIQYLDQNRQQLFLPASPMMGVPGAAPGMGQGVPSNQTSMQGAGGTTPGLRAPTVVPQQQTSVPKSPGYSGQQRSELTRSV